jgi:hypothetical protein
VLGFTVPETRGRGTAALLWVAAFVLMAGAAVWQRLTGPTRPQRGQVVVAGQDVRFRLVRSSVSGEPFLVAIPVPAGVTGAVHYRRFPLDEPFREVPMTREGETLAALLPTQPPAGKLEYYATLATPGGTVRVPEGKPVVMRFKGDVPAGVLVPHVVAMFLSMLIGVRAALAALLGRPEAKRYAWVALVGITIGGLVLGPIVQKYAFGAYWTGWPFGEDLTDNKTLAMWLAWVVAVAVLARRREPGDRVGRWTVVAACLVTIAVYLVPHSLRGSQLDYGRLEKTGAPQGSVTTGP